MMTRLRHALKTIAKFCWRLHGHLWVVVAILLLVISMSVWRLAHSESGSRWLLEQLVAKQKLVKLQWVSGSLANGLVLKDFRFTGKTFYLHADNLRLHISWAGLLTGHLFVDYLYGDGVRLVMIAPPNSQRTKLKHIRLPFHLQLAHGVLTNAQIDKRGVITPIQRLELVNSQWQGTQLDIGFAVFQHPKLSTQLHGKLAFTGDYPLQATGKLQLGFWQQQRLKPLSVTLGGDLGRLAVHLTTDANDIPIAVDGTLQVIEPALGYQATVRWGKLQVPWLAEQQFQSRYGQLVLQGNKQGLQARITTDLSAKQLPRGDYRAVIETDWHHLRLLPLQARTTLGGVLSLTGQVSWQPELKWDINSQWLNVDLAKKWPLLKPYLPALTGQLRTEGHSSAQASALNLQAQWQSQERWQANLVSQGRFWHWQQNQQLDFSWQQLKRQLPAIGLLEAREGKLHYQGTPTSYQLAVDSEFATPKTPLGQWQLSAQGKTQQLTIEKLAYTGVMGQLNTNGYVNWAAGLTWQADVQMQDFNISTWLPAQYPAQVSGYSQTTGHWSAQKRDLQLANTELTGTLKGLAFRLVGDSQYTLLTNQRLPEADVQQLALQWGDNQIRLDGHLGQQWDLTADSQLANLAQLDERLAGQLSGVVVLQGDQHSPNITLNLWADNLKAGSLAAKSLSVSGTLPALGEQVGFLQITARDLEAANRVIPDLGIIIEGTRSAHHLTWQVLAEPVIAEGTLAGGLDSQFNWQGVSDSSTVKVGEFLWELSQPFATVWTQTDKQLSLAAHCWQAEQASLCNQDTLIASPSQIEAKLKLDGLEISRLHALFPEGLAWQGTLAGQAALDWRPNQAPKLAMELVTNNGALGLAREDEDPLTLPYHQLKLAAQSQDDASIKFRFDMQAPNMGQGYVEARINPDEKPYQINGAMVLEQVNLAILKPFMPAMSHLAGEMNLAGGLSGPITGPDFYGEFSLKEGEMTAKNAPIDLTKTQVTASIRGKEATIIGQLNSGEGVATLKGSLDWQQEPHLKLAFNGDKLELKQKPLFRAELSPQLDIMVKPYYVDIKGTAKVENALLRPQTLSDKAIPLSADVRVIDLDAKDRIKIAKAMRQWDINADIELLLADNVLFQGFGLTSKLTGNLKLQQQKQRGMQAIGEIQLDKEAKYEAYGQKLAIRRGQILFAGSMAQPALDIEAVKEVDSKVVGVRVDGRANAPTLTLFADTAMTQDEMLGYLLLGRPLYQDGQLNTTSTGNDSALLTSAALSLGIKGGQGLANDIGNAFGVKDVTLDAEGSGDDTRFTVSGYLSPRLYLRYGVGVFTPVNKVTLRYKLNQSLYLEAVSSLESALDLFYNFKF
ncbi:translocation/assembly module TamB domain-containing protein [Agitococcus lubricus]|uniref:Autotransporter translocation and assembly factor TamB n=1 Tax=Agitococcus lubricus TaxID=1077255 RepID=A0A2T5J243_9GAMM|nr:translocation/assembly module TamB domain-containing protein [Agitococcus lubricus]PTQ90468.1 autotransporter translocation and assembly factor TamB [Agitococcus lubricus]